MAENMNQTTATEETVMTKDVFKKTFWRSFPLQACFCYERMQNVGFAYQMVPALKKLYPDKKEASEALKRHLAIFNTTPAIVSFITGAEIVVQDIFDAIITGFLPLCLTLGTYKLLQKGIKTTTILWGMIIVGIIGSVIGIF